MDRAHLLAVVFGVLACSKASLAQCGVGEEFNIQYGTGPPAFAVSPNGTCRCAAGGFTGNGTLLTLDRNPVVQNHTSQIAGLVQAVATQQTIINSLLSQLASQPTGSGSPYPAGTLSSTLPTSCRAIKAATPSSISKIYNVLGPTGSYLQFYCDMTTDGGGGWTMVWKASSSDLVSTALDYFIGAKPIVAQSSYMMFAFADANNALTAAWKFPTPPPFTMASPMSIDYCNYNLINATRISDGLSTQQILRVGYSTFGSMCDEGCFAPGMQVSPYTAGGVYGHICLKNNNIVAPPWGGVPAGGSTPAGFLDFPYYTAFAVNGVDYCSRSDQGYSTTACSASRLFAILVR